MQTGARLRQEWGGTTGRTPDKKFFGRIWPNGNFSVGVGAVGVQALEMEEESEVPQARYGAAGSIADAVSALTSSNALNSHTPNPEPTQRGLKGITPMGQQMLRSACYLLERDYGNQDLCFATLTVPALPRGARFLLAQNWSELVRQLLQWVSRKLMSAGRPIKVCGCTEIQSGRLASRGEAYLHLHLVWPAHSNSAGRLWAVEWAEIRDWWERALVRFSCCELPHHPRVELAPVKKSAERYMGKYLSKGSGEALDGFIADLGEYSVPPTWWFMTADMRHQVKDETSRGSNTGALLYAVVEQALSEGDLGDFVWVRPVMLAFGDREIHIGWCGRLAPWARDDCFGLLSPLTERVQSEHMFRF